MAAEDPFTYVWAWWGIVIAAAIEDQDQDSRQQLADATGDPEAWKAFAQIKDDEQATEDIWAETLELFASDIDHTDASRPAPGEPGYDPVLAKAGEYSIRIIRGALAGNALCLPR
jgi:hypothetical protein